MPTSSFPQDWLTPLRRLLPVEGVLHVGAGAGLAAERYADWDVAAAVFVEAEASRHSKLAAMLPMRLGWSHHAALLSDHPGEQDFYLASNPDESGILPPESLAGLWRNLKTLARRPLQATTLETLLAAWDGPTPALNWAVIDCLPALPVLRGAGRHLDGWDVILARVIFDERQLPGQGASKPELDVFLAAHGYRCLAFLEERQPAVGCAVYVRDWKATLGARLAQAQQQIEQAAQARDEQARLAAQRQAELEQAAQARDEQARLAAQRQAELEQTAQARDEQADEAKAALEKLAAARQAELDVVLERIDSHHAKLTAQFTYDLLRTRRLLENNQAKQSLNTVKQLEAFLCIQNYLGADILMPDMHGWPVSPDLALYLIRLIETNDYDLVIEFGSGASTCIMAFALQRNAQRRALAAPIPYVAFEHLEEYHRQTLAALRRAGCLEAVQVVLAPLAEAAFTDRHGTEYAYYPCQATLENLARQQGGQARKILLVIDGPPAMTGKHARYPALPLVLRHFPQTPMDAVLDDHIRDDEKETAAMWAEDLDALEKPYAKILCPFEKEACLLQLGAASHLGGV